MMVFLPAEEKRIKNSTRNFSVHISVKLHHSLFVDMFPDKPHLLTPQKKQSVLSSKSNWFQSKHFQD